MLYEEFSNNILSVGFNLCNNVRNPLKDAMTRSTHGDTSKSLAFAAASRYTYKVEAAKEVIKTKLAMLDTYQVTPLDTFKVEQACLNHAKYNMFKLVLDAIGVIPIHYQEYIDTAYPLLITCLQSNTTFNRAAYNVYSSWIDSYDPTSLMTNDAYIFDVRTAIENYESFNTISVHVNTVSLPDIKFFINRYLKNKFKHLPIVKSIQPSYTPINSLDLKNINPFYYDGHVLGQSIHFNSAEYDFNISEEVKLNFGIEVICNEYRLLNILYVYPVEEIYSSIKKNPSTWKKILTSNPEELYILSKYPFSLTSVWKPIYDLFPVTGKPLQSFIDAYVRVFDSLISPTKTKEFLVANQEDYNTWKTTNYKLMSDTITISKTKTGQVIYSRTKNNTLIFTCVTYEDLGLTNPEEIKLDIQFHPDIPIRLNYKTLANTNKFNETNLNYEEVLRNLYIDTYTTSDELDKRISNTKSNIQDTYFRQGISVNTESSESALYLYTLFDKLYSKENTIVLKNKFEEITIQYSSIKKEFKEGSWNKKVEKYKGHTVVGYYETQLEVKEYSLQDNPFVDNRPWFGFTTEAWTYIFDLYFTTGVNSNDTSMLKIYKQDTESAYTILTVTGLKLSTNLNPNTLNIQEDSKLILKNKPKDYVKYSISSSKLSNTFDMCIPIYDHKLDTMFTDSSYNIKHLEVIYYDSLNIIFNIGSDVLDESKYSDVLYNASYFCNTKSVQEFKPIFINELSKYNSVEVTNNILNLDAKVDSYLLKLQEVDSLNTFTTIESFNIKYKDSYLEFKDNISVAINAAAYLPTPIRQENGVNPMFIKNQARLGKILSGLERNNKTTFLFTETSLNNRIFGNADNTLDISKPII